MRILRVIARLNLGGPAHQASLLSGHRLDPNRFRTLLVHGQLPVGEESMVDVAEAEGAHLEFLPTLVQPVRPPDDIRAVRSLARIARRYRPDIVHTHTAKAGVLGRQAVLTLRPRPVIVHTFHGHDLEGYFGRIETSLYRQAERWLARFSDCLIGVSQATVDDLVRLGVAPREKFRVVPLGLELNPFLCDLEGHRAEVRGQLGIGDDEVLLLFVGRVVPIKRLDMLLRAVARAANEERSVRLAIVGDGEIRPQLEHLSQALGIAARVNFLGYRRDTHRIVAAADIAVLSSENEGTPVSLIEAGAAGVPGVATAVGGVREVVTPESGILVANGDIVAYAAALVRLAANPNVRRRMGEQARSHVVQRYSASRLISDIEALYEELLSGPRHAG